MDPLSGPFSSESIKRYRALRKNASTLSLDRVHRNKLSLNSTSSRSPDGVEISKQARHLQSPLTSKKRSLAPSVVPEPILMPRNAPSTSNANPAAAPSTNPSSTISSEAEETTIKPRAVSVAIPPPTLSKPTLQSSNTSITSAPMKGPAIRSASVGIVERSVWSDEEDEEEIVKEESTSGSNLFSFRSRPPMEAGHLVKALPGLEADDLPVAKARSVLGLNTDGWELGPGSGSASSNDGESRRHSLIPGVLSFSGRRNSMGMESTTSSIRRSLSIKRSPQSLYLGSDQLSATPSPATSPSSASRKIFGIDSRIQGQPSARTELHGEMIGITGADQSDWEEELENAARSARNRSRLQSAMLRRGSADSALDQTQFRRSLRKQTSSSGIGDYITSYEMPRSKGSEKTPLTPQTSATGRTIYIKPLNLPSPEAVRIAGRARGRNNQGRPKHDPNPLPSRIAAGKSPIRSQSAAGHYAGDSSIAIKSQATKAPPRPARSHLRSTSESRRSSCLASEIARTKQKLSPLLSAEDDPLSSSLPALPQEQAAFPAFTAKSLSTGPSEGSTNSPELVLSSSTSPASSWNPSISFSREELEPMRLTSPALGTLRVDFNDEGSDPSDMTWQSKPADIRQTAQVNILPPASSAFLAPPRMAPTPPSPVLSSTSSGDSQSSKETTSNSARNSISKKMSHFFNSKTSSLLNSLSSAQSISEGNQDHENEVPPQDDDPDDFIILQLPPDQDRPALSQDEVARYPVSARSSFLSASSLRCSIAEGQESRDFAKALSSLSFVDHNPVDIDPPSVSSDESSRPRASFIDHKDNRSEQPRDFRSSSSYHGSSLLSPSLSSNKASSSLVSRNECSRSTLPDVPRPMSGTSADFDFDFDFEADSLRGSRLTLQSQFLRESEESRRSQLSPLSDFQSNRARDDYSTSIYSRSSTVDHGDLEALDLLESFKLQGFSHYTDEF